MSEPKHVLVVSACLPFQSNQVIWRPDFGAAKVTKGSEREFGLRAGSVTINTAVGVACLLIPGHLPVCTSSCWGSHTPSGVSNRPIRKRDVEQQRTAEKKGMEMMASRLPLPAFNAPHVFLDSSVSPFFQMCPDVAGDVQSITGESLPAWQRAVGHCQRQIGCFQACL